MDANGWRLGLSGEMEEAGKYGSNQKSFCFGNLVHNGKNEEPKKPQAGAKRNLYRPNIENIEDMGGRKENK